MIDLHTHSSYSDGTQTPAELMAAARDAGISTLGLTDHDTIAGWAAAAAAVAGTGVNLVRGMEVTAHYNDAGTPLSVHMLAYLFDPQAPELAAHRENLRTSRITRAQHIVARLAEDLPISWQDVVEIAGPDAVVGRPHIADALVVAGIVDSREQAFANYLSPRGKYYVRNYSPDVFDVIAWINAAGGRAVFAHPAAVKRGKTVPLQALDAMAEVGLFGVEVHHRDNPESLRGQLAEKAEQLGLCQFGSSDYHGAGKPNRLGEHTTDSETLKLLAQGAFLEVIHP
ncbi:PHP domain-containing protein [Trueperella pyogenes]|uniref:PHP domain-containing protein n=1 Tax=Trueperella pyogenes TaxID=1661 RepID=UPI00345CB4D8